LEAVITPGNGLGAPGEGLIVEAGIWHGPVKVFTGQGLPAILAVVYDPALGLIVSFGPDDTGLIGE